MTNSANGVFPETDLRREYCTLAHESRYAHFVRIPDRICRCLGYFKVAFNRAAVKERLHSYYLFIGVVDDVLDSADLGAGREILKQVTDRTPSIAPAATPSPAWLATEMLKRNIEEQVYPVVVVKLEELYQAVVRERNSRTLKCYGEERRIVGRLTAELSYLLIKPLLECDPDDLRDFLQEVGEVGCLVDSSIDLRVDHRLGLLNFRPTLKDHLTLIVVTLRQGIKTSLKHPRLFGLFLEAMGDNCLDRLRIVPRNGDVAPIDPIETHAVVAGASPDALSSAAWTKP